MRYEHVTLKEPATVIFDFLGKDSVRFFQKFEVIPQVFKNIRKFKALLSEGDKLFDRLTVSGPSFL